MAILTDDQLRTIRDEVGSSPTENDLQDLWDALGSTTAVALAVLRPRLADALAAAASGSLSIAGAISVGAPAQPTMLLEQIQRLEGQLLSEGGAVPGAGTVKMRRCDQARGLSFRP